MTIWVDCYRVYLDENEIQVLEPYEKWDTTFEDEVKALEYMNDKCGDTTCSEAFLFYVNVTRPLEEEE